MARSNSCKIPQGETKGVPEAVKATTVESRLTDSCDVSMTICDHKTCEAANSLMNTITNETSIVTLSIQSASDDNDEDDGGLNKEHDTTMIMTDENDRCSSDTNDMADSSASFCGNLIVRKPPASLSENVTSVVYPDSTSMRKSVATTCQFTIGDSTKQQQVYCQEKDGLVYFISWRDKQLRSRRISKLDAQHDTVITYDPSTNTLGPKQLICCRANMTYAFGMLNFKNRIVLVAGNNFKFLDGSVYLYQLVECKRYQRAFGYKWSEMAKSVRSCSPVVASPTHAICTTTDDCIMVCQLSNNSDCTLKALSINIYSEACSKEDTKWKVVSLNLPTTLLYKNGHLTSGAVHEKDLYLSIKTGEGFGVMKVSITNLVGPNDPIANTMVFHTVTDEPPLTQYFLFDYSNKLFSSSIIKHAASSCSIGQVTVANSSVIHADSIVHCCDPIANVQLHSVIPVPKCEVLILVYYSPQFQNYILNSISSSLL